MKKQILLGTLLGDASIGKLQKKERTFRISWQHCMKQEQYALWKAENSLNNYSIFKRSTLDVRTNKIYHSITCYSRKDNYLYYRELFYKEHKEVSQEILNMLEPLGVAVWFMDDGSLYYNGNNCHLTLAVNGFNEESVNRIILYFKNNYNINFKKAQKLIRLTSVKEVQLFESFFKQYYHNSMNYKTLEFNKNKYNNTLTDEQKKCRNKKYL